MGFEHQGPASAQGKVRVLFLTANPHDTTHLSITEEYRIIQQRLRAAPSRDRCESIFEPEVRAADLAETLLRCAPTVVHFSGHGSADGELLLPDATGRAAPVTLAAFAGMFAALPRALRVRCVVLNACYSDALARALVAHVDCVIGVQTALHDRVALPFAGGFYGALGFGLDVRSAYQLGCNEVERVVRSAGETMPVLHCRAGLSASDVRPLAPATDVPQLPRGLRRGAERGVYVWDGGRGLDVEMVYVPSGEFVMGDDALVGSTPTQRHVFAHGFYLARYPVTVGQFARFARERAYKTDAEQRGDRVTWRAPGFSVAQVERHPVVCVSGADARAWAAWAGLELPTEVEWEYAARGPTGRCFPWGDDAPEERLVAWSARRRRDGCCPVGEHPGGASWCGAHDMAGNVWEWTASPWSPTPPRPGTSPTTVDGVRRVVRGGSWIERNARRLQCAYRDAADDAFAADDRGMRCVLRAEA